MQKLIDNWHKYKTEFYKKERKSKKQWQGNYLALTKKMIEK